MAGYRVYRRRPGEPEMVLLTPKPLRENIFFYPVPSAGEGLVRYQVTAVDGSPRANESRPSPAAEVRLDPPGDEPAGPQ